jgi:hypothetical protein
MEQLALLAQAGRDFGIFLMGIAAIWFVTEYAGYTRKQK